jgi:hypothetical protein
MNTVKVEAFLSEPQTTADERLTQLLKKFESEQGGKLHITIYTKGDGRFSRYNLTRSPALVIGEIIKIVGFCPSEESIMTALKELGVS